MLCVNCVHKMRMTPLMHYLLKKAKRIEVRRVVDVPRILPERRRMSVMKTVRKMLKKNNAAAILDEVMKANGLRTLTIFDTVDRFPVYEVDRPMLAAAKREGCDPCLCHVCEKPFLVGQRATWAQMRRPVKTPEGAIVTAFSHYDCRRRFPVDPFLWRRKYGRET